MKSEHYEQIFELTLSGEGKILKGYSNFHNYSFCNQMWAYFQLLGKGQAVQPIATYKKWAELGRQVKKGSKAIELCIPNKWQNKDTNEEGMYFAFKKLWFSFEDTDGEEVEFPKVNFDIEKCLEVLGIVREEFQHIDGNCQGYAKKGKVIAINPVAQLPMKTLFHETAHQLLGHCDGQSELVDSVATEKNIKEVEAESVALCVSLALGLDENVEYCVGYVRSYLKSNVVPVESIKRIFKITDIILKAGQ